MDHRIKEVNRWRKQNKKLIAFLFAQITMRTVDVGTDIKIGYQYGR